MKKKLFYLTILFSLLLFLFEVLGNPKETILIASKALHLFQEKLFPSLFPFLVLGETLILLGIPNYLSLFLEKPFQKLFKISGTASFVILMSLLSGFPSGPKYVKSLYLKGDISKEEGNRLLKIVHFSNPLFILGTVFLVIKNRQITIFILLAHFLSNFLLLWFTKKEGGNDRFLSSRSSLKKTFNFYVEKMQEIGIGFLDAIKSSIDTMLFMLGSITFFMLFSSILTKFCKTPFLKTLLTGILDLTSGIFALDTLKVSLLLKGLFATFFLSFGSFSVGVQVFNVLKETDLSFLSFLKGRIISSALSLLLFLLFFFFFVINGGCY